jgi:hypothetical protein
MSEGEYGEEPELTAEEIASREELKERINREADEQDWAEYVARYKGISPEVVERQERFLLEYGL